MHLWMMILIKLYHCLKGVKLKKLIISSCLALMLSGCYFEVIDSGETGVEVSNGKVSETVLNEGFQFSLNPLTDLNLYNTKSKVLEMSDYKRENNKEVISTEPVLVLTKDNLQIPVDITILYKLEKTCAPFLRINYGEDGIWDRKIVVPKARDISRSVIGKDADVYKLNQNREIYTSEIRSELGKQLNGIVGKENCILIDSVSINNIKIPQQLAESILKKQQTEEAVKIANLEIERIKAQAQAEIEKNKGISEAQKILAQSLTPQMLQWKELEVRQMEIEKWNGVMPTTLMSDKASLLIQR